MKWVVLCNKDDIRKTESEEQLSFIRQNIEFALNDIDLEQDSLPALESCFPDNDSELYTVEQKINLRKVLGHFNISVLNDRDGGVKIYLDRQVFAEWRKPTFVLKEDSSVLDRNKKLYGEITFDAWSQFQENIEDK